MSSYSINGRHPKWRMVVLSAVSLAFVDAFVATVSFAAPDANTASSSTANSEPGTAAIDQKTPTGSTAAVDPRMNEDARKLFGAKKKPASLPTLSIGTATCGCIAGAKKLALNGPYWQVMRPSRNRYYGHPSMLTYIEKFAKRAHDVGWESLLIGDLNMPRGGPMPSGHASHQRGTDVDIWLQPGPAKQLSLKERETLEAGSVLKLDSAELDAQKWTPQHAAFVKAAAQDDNVARIFVTPSIKKALCSCKAADGSDTAWLRRLRPWEGHDDHIHVRLICPPGEKCVEQEPPPEGDGCGEELDDWMKKTALDPPHKSSHPGEVPDEPMKPFPLAKMPVECIEVLDAR
ncbi:MAG: penicillin-insensitive murein endopeptidase [Candidatus Obscuribacterales bacterium]|jgi:penicillin-insensitive murein endopeptidase|nr:penicillin-insensitive murein endopeptidase [Candidatus Obscuribacterales bacterium]